METTGNPKPTSEWKKALRAVLVANLVIAALFVVFGMYLRVKMMGAASEEQRLAIKNGEIFAAIEREQDIENLRAFALKGWRLEKMNWEVIVSMRNDLSDGVWALGLGALANSFMAFMGLRRSKEKTNGATVLPPQTGHVPSSE